MVSPTPPKASSGIRLITAKVVKDGRILDEPKEHIAADFYDVWMRRGLPRRLDVLITTEAPLGEVALLRDSEKIALAQRIILLRARQGVLDPRFLYYSLQSPVARAELRSKASGTTVSGIKQSELRRIRIPFPKLSTQVRIAGLLAAYDDLIEKNLRRIQILEVMARAIYRQWFVHFRFPEHEGVDRGESSFGPIPKEFAVVPCSGVAVYLNGFAFKPTQWGTEGLPIIKIQELKAGISTDTPRNPGTGIPTKFMVRDGDVLFSWSADLEVYLWREGAALLNQHLFNVLPHEGYSRAYCYHALAEVMPRFRALSLGSTMHHIKRSALDHVSLIVPPPPLRRQFDRIVEPIHGSLVRLSKVILNLRATRDLLLPRLMSGQLTLPEAEEAIPTPL